jgi:hypothetical protein
MAVSVCQYRFAIHGYLDLNVEQSAWPWCNPTLMLGAPHSNEELNEQVSTLHAPTPPILSGTPPFLAACRNVSQQAHTSGPPTVIARAWHCICWLYEHSVTSHAVILDIFIAIKCLLFDAATPFQSLYH